MESRKQELEKELKIIRDAELKVRMDEASDLAGTSQAIDEKEKAKSHRWIMMGDFGIKLFIAVIISMAFMYITIQGTTSNDVIMSKSSGTFQLLSVIGPLFGIVLQYYFGTKKKSANGE